MDSKEMKRKVIAYKFVYSFLIAFAVGIVLGFGAPSAQGNPITVEGFGMALLQGTLVGGVVGFVLPVPRILGFYFRKLEVTSKLGQKFVTDIVMATIFAIVMGLYFTAVNTGFETYMTDAGPVTYMGRVMNGFTVCWAFIFIGAFLTGPICTTIAIKVTGFDPDKAAAAKRAAEEEAANEEAANEEMADEKAADE